LTARQLPAWLAKRLKTDAIPTRRFACQGRGINAYRVVSHIDEAPVGENSLVQLKVADTAVAHISDEDLIEKTRARFQVLTDMTKAVKAGDVRAMIVTGPQA
jgi:hypothetical protein